MNDLDILSTIAFYYISVVTGIFVFYDFVLLYLLAKSYGKNIDIVKVSYNEAKRTPDSELPIVTILLPVYREKLTLPYLIESISRMDYPRDRMDIRFLIENDDKDTVSSIKALTRANMDNNIQQANTRQNDDQIHQVKARNGISLSIDYIEKGIRTKPNALNVGLDRARGEIITIYDAEDRPDPNQMRAIAAYMLNHPDVGCVQARLAYYNDSQSLLTRLFAIEYNQHFLVSLPTYFSLKNAILLGGTSNFIRTDILKSLGGWDPKNVTEDADLGIRLARTRCSVVPMDVITYEEAPPKIHAWMKQRIRWNKGYLYTLLRHFRNPIGIINDIGFKSFLLTFHQLLFPVVSALSIPGWVLFAIYWIDWFGFPLQPMAGWINAVFKQSPVLFYTSLLTLAFGPVYSILMSLEGLFRQEDEYALSKVKYVVFNPLYVILQGICSIVAIIELVAKPQLWHKTHHGFSVQDNDNKELVLSSEDDQAELF